MKPTVSCPLCDWTLELDPTLTDRNAAPAVAAALGMPAHALLSIHAHQAAQRTESLIDAHMRSHQPKDWLPALMDARRQITRRDDLVAELRRHLEVLERRVAGGRPR